MAERALRGSRLGSLSYETDGESTELAERRDITYRCPQGHLTVMPFAAEADVPAEWPCRTCGVLGLAVDGPAPEARKVKHQRTHWDMLLERRSYDDLEEVLAERLAVLHGEVRKTA